MACPRTPYVRRQHRRRPLSKWHRSFPLSLERLEARDVPASLDLTGSGVAIGGIGGAVFSRLHLQGTGSGVIDSFLRVGSNSDVEQGYNSDLPSQQFQFDEVGGGFTHSLAL